MRFTIEVQYDADRGEDVGEVGRVFADELIGFDGVTEVTVHGEEATIITRPDSTPIVRFT